MEATVGSIFLKTLSLRYRYKLMQPGIRTERAHFGRITGTIGGPEEQKFIPFSPSLP